MRARRRTRGVEYDRPSASPLVALREAVIEMIDVELAKATEGGRLYPRYVRDSKILAVESHLQHEWPYGINIDNLIILDITETRLLANVEVHMPRRLWKHVDPFPDPPNSRLQADLHLSQQAIEQKFFTVNVAITTNTDRSKVLIRIGNAPPEETGVELSEHCTALVAEHTLVGFRVDLST